MKHFFVTATLIGALLAGVCKAQDKKTVPSEIKKEFNVNKNSIIRINNNNKNIEVKSWKEDKVRIVVNGISASDNNDAENIQTDNLFEKLGITVHQLGNNFTVSIKDGSSDFSFSTRSTGSDVFMTPPVPPLNSIVLGGPAVTGMTSSTLTRKSSALKQAVTLYVPQSGKLRIDSKYGNLSFTNTIDNLDLDITNGNADAENIGDLKLISKYGNFTCGDIKSGSIDFINGRFTANNADELDMDTKYANIEVAVIKNLTFISTNDDYELDEVGEAKGRKNYGNFRVEKLNRSLELEGTNADIKIKTISSFLSLIKIDDKYADLRLPMRNVKSYSFEVAGTYNTVYSTSDTENVEGNKEDNGQENSKVKGIVGDGKGARVNVKCQNCTIDLK
jgi:hypothetical protein